VFRFFGALRGTGMKRCIVIGNGIIEDYSWHKSLLGDEDIILCADGGADHAFRLGLLPRGIAGDLDSVDPEILQKFREQGVEIRKHSPVKDEVDTQITLDWAFEFAPPEVLLLGCTGKRLDHTLANIHLLLRGATRGVRVRLVNEKQDVSLVTPNLPVELNVSAGTVISLLPLSERACGVEVHNMEYAVPGGVLEAGETIGISNVAIGCPIRIKIASGSLLVFVNTSEKY
jgi:thiamine pyrophosphokinase